MAYLGLLVTFSIGFDIEVCQIRWEWLIGKFERDITMLRPHFTSNRVPFFDVRMPASRSTCRC